ncbi:hypothetical protein NL676_030384 [Syzygium grande]|nr:hypothetical protein NL676_030384 [Syzygium grande]
MEIGRKRARPPGLYASKIANGSSAIREVVSSRSGKSPTEATGLDGSRRSGFARLSVSHQIWVHGPSRRSGLFGLRRPSGFAGELGSPES